MHTQVEAKIPLIAAEDAKILPARIEDDGLALEISVSSWLGNGADNNGLPRARAFLAHDGESLFLRFKTREAHVRAVNTNTQDPVWQDSCVEFFFSLDTVDGIAEPMGYYNLECNAIGTILYYFGTDRHARTPAPHDSSSIVITYPSLGKRPFDTKSGPIDWSVDIVLPAKAFFKHPGWIAPSADIKNRPPLSGKSLRANFYKCGDKLPRPHYLSWQRIATEKPDFHRPEYFSTLRFE